MASSSSEPPGADVAGVDVGLRGSAGPHLRADVERRAPACAHQPRHVLGGQPAAGHQPGRRSPGRTRRWRAGRRSPPPCRAATRPTARAPDAAGLSSRRQERRGSSAGVDGAGEGPRHARAAGRPAAVQVSTSISRSASRNPNDDALRAAARGSPRPARRAASSSPPVVVHESLSRSSTNIGTSASRLIADTRAGSGERAQAHRPGQPRAADRHRRRRCRDVADGTPRPRAAARPQPCAHCRWLRRSGSPAGQNRPGGLIADLRGAGAVSRPTAGSRLCDARSRLSARGLDVASAPGGPTSGRRECCTSRDWSPRTCRTPCSRRSAAGRCASAATGRSTLSTSSPISAAPTPCGSARSRD